MCVNTFIDKLNKQWDCVFEPHAAKRMNVSTVGINDEFFTASLVDSRRYS